jgi:hypothetical protein
MLEVETIDRIVRMDGEGLPVRRGGIAAAPTAPSAGSAWRRWSARSPAPATPGRGRSVSAALLCMTRSRVRRPPPAERYPLSASSALVGRLTAPRNALTRLLSGPPHPRGPQQRERVAATWMSNLLNSRVRKTQ